MRPTDVLLASLVLAVASGAHAAPSPPEPRPVKLLVTVVVDGVSWPRLEQARPLLVGGLKRLLDEGHVFTRSNFRHLNTETSPGHAAISTGAPPRVTGVVGNRWFIRSPDGITKVVSSIEQPPPATLGPAALRVPTLGDLLIQTRPDSRIVSLSPKDRSAAFLAGRDPRHVVYWYEKTSGRLVTSAAYDTAGIAGSRAKAIVDRFNRERGGTHLPGRFGLLWRQIEEAAPRPWPPVDLTLHQIPSLGLEFDHPLDRHRGGYFEALYESGLVDEIVADLVVKFLADEELGLGRQREPDVLNVSLAAHDIVAHSYGTESLEADDAIRRLDRQIGRILTALEEKFAPGEMLIALSADHGFSPIPEALRRAGETRTGGRLVTSEQALPAFQARLSRMLAASLCLDPATSQVLATDTSWNLAWAGPFPQRTVEGSCGSSGREVSRLEMSRTAKRLIVNHFAEEVEEVLLVDEQVAWPTSKAVEMARNVLDIERIGDVLLIPRPHALVHWDPARGSGHGSHHAYDTHVPLIFWGAGFESGTSSDPVSPYDLAPTLGAAVGIKLPQATGRSLLPTPR